MMRGLRFVALCATLLVTACGKDKIIGTWESESTGITIEFTPTEMRSFGIATMVKEYKYEGDSVTVYVNSPTGNSGLVYKFKGDDLLCQELAGCFKRMK